MGHGLDTRKEDRETHAQDTINISTGRVLGVCVTLFPFFSSEHGHHTGVCVGVCVSLLDSLPLSTASTRACVRRVFPSRPHGPITRACMWACVSLPLFSPLLSTPRARACVRASLRSFSLNTAWARACVLGVCLPVSFVSLNTVLTRACVGRVSF